MQPAISALVRFTLTLAVVSFVVVVNRPVEGDEVAADAVRCELDPPKSAAGLEACVVRSPRHLELLVELGTAYEAAGRTAEARSAYQRAIEVDPSDADAQRRLARLSR